MSEREGGRERKKREGKKGGNCAKFGSGKISEN